MKMRQFKQLPDKRDKGNTAEENDRGKQDIWSKGIFIPYSLKYVFFKRTIHKSQKDIAYDERGKYDGSYIGYVIAFRHIEIIYDKKADCHSQALQKAY